MSDILDVLVSGSTVAEYENDTVTSVAFGGCSGLPIRKITLSKATTIKGMAFAHCTELTALILSGSTVCTLSLINAFTDTPIEDGTGYIYVPEDLVDSYKAASNWSTYADQIVAIT